MFRLNFLYKSFEFDSKICILNVAMQFSLFFPVGCCCCDLWLLCSIWLCLVSTRYTGSFPERSSVPFHKMHSHTSYSNHGPNNLLSATNSIYIYVIFSSFFRLPPEIATKTECRKKKKLWNKYNRDIRRSQNETDKRYDQSAKFAYENQQSTNAINNLD